MSATITVEALFGQLGVKVARCLSSPPKGCDLVPPVKAWRKGDVPKTCDACPDPCHPEPDPCDDDECVVAGIKHKLRAVLLIRHLKAILCPADVKLLAESLLLCRLGAFMGVTLTSDDVDSIGRYVCNTDICSVLDLLETLEPQLDYPTIYDYQNAAQQVGLALPTAATLASFSQLSLELERWSVPVAVRQHFNTADFKNVYGPNRTFANFIYATNTHIYPQHPELPMAEWIQRYVAYELRKVSFETCINDLICVVPADDCDDHDSSNCHYYDCPDEPPCDPLCVTVCPCDDKVCWPDPLCWPDPCHDGPDCDEICPKPEPCCPEACVADDHHDRPHDQPQGCGCNSVDRTVLKPSKPVVAKGPGDHKSKDDCGCEPECHRPCSQWPDDVHYGANTKLWHSNWTQYHLPELPEGWRYHDVKGGDVCATWRRLFSAHAVLNYIRWNLLAGVEFPDHERDILIKQLPLALIYRLWKVCDLCELFRLHCETECAKDETLPLLQRLALSVLLSAAMQVGTGPEVLVLGDPKRDKHCRKWPITASLIVVWLRLDSQYAPGILCSTIDCCGNIQRCALMTAMQDRIKKCRGLGAKLHMWLDHQH